MKKYLNTRRTYTKNEIECKEHHRNKELETLRKTTKWEAWAEFYKVRNRLE